MVSFAREVCETDLSVMCWGANRVATTVAAYAIAAGSAQPIVWVDIRDPAVKVESYDEVLADLVPPGQHYVTRAPADLAPEPANSNVALWTLIQSDETQEEVLRLSEFLRLPTSIRSLMARTSRRSERWTLFVTNSDRIASIYPEDVDSTRAYVRAVSLQSVKLIATLVGLERKDRRAYDFVFRIDCPNDRPWNAAMITVEQGDVPASTAGAGPTPLVAVKEVADLFQLLGPTVPSAGTTAGSTTS